MLYTFSAAGRGGLAAGRSGVAHSVDVVVKRAKIKKKIEITIEYI